MNNTSCTCNRNPDDLLTISEAADLANVSEKTIRRRVWSRELPHLRVGSRSIRIRRSDLDEWIHDGLVPALSVQEIL